jgi:hypothetical protein
MSEETQRRLTGLKELYLESDDSYALNIPCSRCWRDASDGQLFGDRQRRLLTAPARLTVALGLVMQSCVVPNMKPLVLPFSVSDSF